MEAELSLHSDFYPHLLAFLMTKIGHFALKF